MMIRYATLVACALAAAHVSAMEESIDKRVAADPKGEVEISNVAGAVNISGWNKNEVEVTGDLGEGVERLDFQGDAKSKHTLIKVVLKRGSHRHDDGDAELNIRVPAGSRLDVNTVSAEITAHGVTGPQQLQSVSGDISSEVSREDAEVKTVSGSVSLRGDGNPGVLTVTTVSGDASVTRTAGEITASTVSGTLELSLDKMTRARLRTTSGDLHLAGTLAPDARLDAETISGGLSVDLKGSVDAEIDVRSFSGDIDNCFGPKPERTSEHGPGSELRFKEGKGSGRVSLSTLSGDVELCKR
jgi:DUF4097 and DUF4098 domain-containing protein YvlB